MRRTGSGGKVITFYSFKGGVGRSMALANVAALLAQQGKKVLALDFDFEAPGLHRYFLSTETPAFTRYEPKGMQQGVIDFFYALRDQLSKEWPDGEGFKEPTTRERVAAIIAQILDSGAYLYRVRLKNPNQRKAPPAEIRFMPAVRFDEGYVERVRRFDWQRFYETYAEVFPILAAELGKRYDRILIDSRTGVTDIGSVCTMLLPEKLVLVFSPNDQSLDGVLEAGWQSVQQRKSSEDDPRPLPLFPLLSRLENSEEALKRTWVDKARGQFERMFREAYSLDVCDLETYFKRVRIPHHSFYAYGERIAAEEQAALETGSLAQAFQQFVECLECESAVEAQNMLEHSGRRDAEDGETGPDQAVFRKLMENETSVREEIRQNPDDPWARLLYANWLIQKKSRRTEAIEVYNEIARRFGLAEDASRQEAVATALLLKGQLLVDMDQREDAVDAYSEVHIRLANTAEPSLGVLVAVALVNKGDTLRSLNRDNDAMTAFDEVLARVGRPTEPALREVAVKATLGKSRSLVGLGRHEDALAICSEMLARVDDPGDPWAPELIAAVSVEEGILLCQLGRYQDSLASFDGVLTRFGHAAEPSLYEPVAHALLNKATALHFLHRNQGAIAACTELLQRFGEAAELTLREQVAEALLKKADYLRELGQKDGVLITYDELLARIGDSTERSLRERGAMALLGKGFCLNDLARYDAAVLVFQEVLRHHGDAPEPQLQKAVAHALNGIGFARLCEAKRAWQDGDEAAAQALLEEADAKIADALKRRPDADIILGNAGYIAFLRGHAEKARDLLARAIQLGGERLREAELKDADRYPLPQDEAFRALLRSFPAAPSARGAQQSDPC